MRLGKRLSSSQKGLRDVKQDFHMSFPLRFLGVKVLNGEWSRGLPYTCHQEHAKLATIRMMKPAKAWSWVISISSGDSIGVPFSSATG